MRETAAGQTRRLFSPPHIASILLDGDLSVGCPVFGSIHGMRPADRNSAPASSKKLIVDLVGSTITTVLPRRCSAIALRAQAAIPCLSMLSVFRKGELQ